MKDLLLSFLRIFTFPNVQDLLLSVVQDLLLSVVQDLLLSVVQDLPLSAIAHRSPLTAHSFP